MNSKIWKLLCECLKRNTTIQPSHHDEDSDVLALAIIELFSDREVKKEFRTVAFGKNPRPPEGDGWTLHSSTSFDATWVRDGTVAADCPGVTRVESDDEWRGVTEEDVGKKFLVKFRKYDGTGRVVIGFIKTVRSIEISLHDRTKMLESRFAKIRDIPS